MRVLRINVTDDDGVLLDTMEIPEEEFRAAQNSPVGAQHLLTQIQIGEPAYSLSDCVNWETNVMGDCGGRVEEVKGVVICETCRNKSFRSSSVFDRPENNVYIIPEGEDL